VEIAISYFTKEGYCKGGIYIKWQKNIKFHFL
jgi:hypothetical protein